jgi:hypothetical protein
MINYWDKAWSYAISQQKSRSDVASTEWKAGGRKTKDYPDKENSTWWENNGPLMVNRWIEWRNGSHPYVIWEPVPGIPAIELSTTPIWNDVPVQMHIDRVMINPDGELVVIDLKTGSRSPSSDLQLAFYAAGIEEEYGIRPKWGAYWMGRNGGIKELVDLDAYPKDMIIELVTKFDTARKAELFMPNLNHCVMCSVKDKCKWNKKRIEEIDE